MGMIWDNLWAIYGFHMVLIWDITHHIKPILWYVLALYCLIYGKDTYFVKIHTISLYGNGMGALTSSIPNPHLWKDTYFVKIDTIPIHGNDMGYRNGLG